MDKFHILEQTKLKQNSMEIKNDKLQNALQYGYQLDFGTVMEKSFDQFKKTWATGGVAILLIALVIGVFTIGAMGMLIGFSSLTNPALLAEIDFSEYEIVSLLIYAIIIAIASGILAPMNAGLIQLIHEAKLGKPLSIGIVFQHYKSPKFKDLFLAGFIIGSVSSFLTVLLQYYGAEIFANGFNYLINYFTFLVSPIIIFGNRNGIDSISDSILLVIKNIPITAALLVVSGIFVVLGLFAICIGIIFTSVFYYCVVYHIYDSIAPIVDNNLIDEIGNE